MNKAFLASAMGMLAALGTGMAQAQAQAQAQEVGRVISSTPVIQQVAVPRQVCTQQQVVSGGSSSGGGAVVGAIVGGLLGNTVGGGSGRILATGAGMLAGAAVGDRVEAGQQPQLVQNCSTQTSYENRTTGYNVQYEYAGKQYQVQMPYDPGPTIRLQVSPVSANQPLAPSTSAAAPAATSGQPVAMILADSSTGTQPVYSQPVYSQPVYSQPVYVQPAYAYPAYQPYYSPWVPPVSLSLGFGWIGGGGHHRHWR